MILHFLNDSAKRVEHMIKNIKTYEDAKQEIRTWNLMEKEKCGLYFL